MKFTFIVLALASAGVLAQSKTNCTRDYWGNFTCQTQPDGGSFIDFGAFQRGADEANQRAQQSEIMQRQLQMQQQMLEQQQQLRLQQEERNAIVEERNAPEWQQGEFDRRDDYKRADGQLTCVDRSRNGFVFSKGKRYTYFSKRVSPQEECAPTLFISKFTGEAK
jgi:hypothetical protein